MTLVEGIVFTCVCLSIASYHKRVVILNENLKTTKDNRESMIFFMPQPIFSLWVSLFPMNEKVYFFSIDSSLRAEVELVKNLSISRCRCVKWTNSMSGWVGGDKKEGEYYFRIKLLIFTARHREKWWKMSRCGMSSVDWKLPRFANCMFE